VRCAHDVVPATAEHCVLVTPAQRVLGKKQPPGVSERSACYQENCVLRESRLGGRANHVARVATAAALLRPHRALHAAACSHTMHMHTSTGSPRGREELLLVRR